MPPGVFAKVAKPFRAIKTIFNGTGYRKILSATDHPLSGGHSHILRPICIAAESEPRELVTHTIAMLDTGSSVNIMSLQVARRLKFRSKNEQATDARIVAFGGQEFRSLGTFKVRFTFCPCSPNRNRRFRETYKYMDAEFEVLDLAKPDFESIIGLKTIEKHELLIPGKDLVLAFREARDKNSEMARLQSYQYHTNHSQTSSQMLSWRKSKRNVTQIRLTLHKTRKERYCTNLRQSKSNC
jgi:hypothetical protein